MPFAGYIVDRPKPDPSILQKAEWVAAKVTGRSSRPVGTLIEVTDSPDERFLFVKKKKGYGTIERRAVEYI